MPTRFDLFNFFLAGQSAQDEPTTRLSLRNRALHCIPSMVMTPAFARFASLDLAHNFISTVPLSLSALTGLESLDLSHNLMAGSLPAQLAEALSLLTQLVHLNLAHNALCDLSALPSQQLQALEELDVSHNGLTAIPAHVVYLTRLRHLSLAGNAFHGEGTDEHILLLFILIFI